MHVIGSPFIQGPALALVVRTPHGDVNIKSIEYFSDSVLFFDLPPYPIPDGMMVTPQTELKVQILVTNAGRTFSNALDFTYIAGKKFFKKVNWFRPKLHEISDLNSCTNNNFVCSS